MSKTIRKNNMRNPNNRQGYFEDECRDCIYYKGKISGCSLTACSCEDIKSDAIAKSKIKRKRGSMKWDM